VAGDFSPRKGGGGVKGFKILLLVLFLCFTVSMVVSCAEKTEEGGGETEEGKTEEGKTEEGKTEEGKTEGGGEEAAPEGK
jgi:hypothetical protein